MVERHNASYECLNPPINPPVKLEIVHAIMDKAKLPTRPDALVEGVLREGGKMVCSGKDKSGKSFLAINLGVCVATGSKWLGLDCKQGRALYLNLEINEADFMERVYDVATALGVDAELAERNFLIVKRPKSGLTITQFVESLSREPEAVGCSLVIIDPQYKIFEGNENEQRDMAEFYAEIDRLISALGCAVFVVHHQSKGYQGNKETSERACGSSVFGRDPDAIMSIDRLSHAGNAMRAGFVLRDYPPIKPIDYWFDHPLCVRDEAGELSDCKMAYGQGDGSGSQGSSFRVSEVDAICERLIEGRDSFNRQELAKELGGVRGEKINRILDKSGRFTHESHGNTCMVVRRP